MSKPKHQLSHLRTNWRYSKADGILTRWTKRRFRKDYRRIQKALLKEELKER